MKLWEKLEQGTEVSNRRAYLYMTVRNRCLDILRSKGLQTGRVMGYRREPLPAASMIPFMASVLLGGEKRQNSFAS